MLDVAEETKNEKVEKTEKTEKAKEENPYNGKWVAVSADLLGVSVTVEEAFEGDFYFEVKDGGKLTFTVGDDSGDGKWSVEGNQFTLSIEGEEMVGTAGEDIITFENMMEEEVGEGLNVIFAKDGTDAMDPRLYLTEEEQAVVGKWMSESVEEVLGDGPQTTMEGVENINDALRLDFTSDKNVTVSYKGEEVGTFVWSVYGTDCMIESEDPSIYAEIRDDGTLRVDYMEYSDDNDYYIFNCVKAE